MPESNNLLMIVAIVAVCVALINLSITVNKISDIKEFTGYAVDYGEANLTIESAASVLYITDSIDWGSGQVDETPLIAHIDTEGNIVDGNWTAVTQGLTLENQGNCNVTFTLTTSNIADSFIPSDAGGANYSIKLTDNITGACGGTNSLESYTNASGAAQNACDDMGRDGLANRIDVDINISIPEGASAGAKGSIITVTAECA